jgi:hypothetical protein
VDRAAVDQRGEVALHVQSALRWATKLRSETLI